MSNIFSETKVTGVEGKKTTFTTVKYKINYKTIKNTIAGYTRYFHTIFSIIKNGPNGF